MKQLALFGLMLAALGFVGASTFLGLQYLELQKVADRNRAINDCYQASRYTYSQEDGATINVPVADNFKSCLELKGLQAK